MKARAQLNRPILAGDGAPNPAAQVYVRPRGSLTTTATGYTTATGVTVQTQPITPDANGMLPGWWPAGRYDVEEHHGPLIVRREWEAFPTTFAAWVPITLQGAWVAVAGFGTPGYSISAEGIVTLRGVVNGGALGSVIGYVAAEAFPTQTIGVVALSGNSFAVLVVGTDGSITLANPPAVNANITLAGIQYSAGAGVS